MSVRPIVLLAAVAALLLVLSVPSLAELYTEWLWFGETGFQQIFLQGLRTKILLGGAAFLLSFAFLLTNLRLALGGSEKPYLVFGGGGEVQPIVLDRRQLRWIATAAAGLVAVFLGLFASNQWLVLLQYLHATPFGETDPLFDRDAAFYIFSLPFLDFARSSLLVVVVLSLIGSAGAYVSSGLLGFDPSQGLTVSPRVRRHLSVLVAALLLLMAWGAYLDVPRLLTTPAGILHGASYVDVAARLWMLRFLVVVSIVGAGLAVFGASSLKLWPIPAAVGLYALVFLGGSAYAVFLQRIIVTPNEQETERPYIEHNIAATRRAFGLEQMEERELSGDASLTRADIANNAETINNVRLWDHEPLLQTFGQIQEIRTYYDFVSVDNDRYVIDGQYRQTMLSSRELNTASLPNPSWVNERLSFTHGYGVALGPVNQVTAEGLPMLFIKNLPPISESPDLQVDEPSIYFGELSNDYVIVNTDTPEFHYPEGDDNVFTTYDGDGGVAVSGIVRRLLFGLRFRSLNLVVSEQLREGSRVLFHRNIRDRVTTIAPFLRYDADPYLVVSEGRLFWIQDAYTVSDRYPYSAPATPGVNYIRNSVKIVIDVYHGRTTFYLADPDDPIALTLDSIFPDFLRPLDEMSADLRAHVRYPEEIFALQTAIYSTYHMTNPAIFYNKEDQWDVPLIDSVPMEPYYTIMKLPGEDEAEFIQMLPFTPRGKNNLAAWMVARSDGAQYGKMFVYRFPKQKVIFGPSQIAARINQDQVISPQITLWNQQGSEVIQGTLLVIPIEEALLYIRPLYLRAAGGRIPELKRVIVAYQNQIVMEDTLDLSLGRLFGPGAGDAPPTLVAAAAPPAGAPAPVSVPVGSLELAQQASSHYQRALQAQREGNWSLYGNQIQQLGQLLATMAGGETEP